MKGTLAMAAVAAILVMPVSAQQRIDPEVIYGEDDRLDLHQVKEQKLLQAADSTVGLFESSKVNVDQEKGTAQLSLQSYAQAYSLCKEEPFYDQQLGAFCSGSLVGPDLLMTAGHCVTSQSECEGTKFVFGFGIKEKGKNPSTVPAGDVYGCKTLLGRVQENSGADWALIKLDRPVPNHKPLSVSRTGKLEKGAPIVVIGHPAGLPTKVSGGANVRDYSPKGYFVANLDTYGGNSGSAVFNAKSLQVEGILVRGEADYVWRGGCRVSNVCTNEGCRGEDVTKVSALMEQIPPTVAEGLTVARATPSFFNLLDEALKVQP